jgi:uncharacterized membrane protein YqaE (UPF0057 family)
LGYAKSSHFVDVFVAMLLPAIAVAAEAVARRWRFLLPVVLALFLIGIPGNIEALNRTFGPYTAAFQSGNKQFLMSVVALPIAREMERSYEPNGLIDPGVSMGWLLEQRTNGRLPASPPLTRRQAADMSLTIAVGQNDSRSTAPSCQVVATTELRHLGAGRSLRFSGGDLDMVLVTTAGNSDRFTFRQSQGHSLVVFAPVTVWVSPADSAEPVTLCS